jgi:ubiquinone/menaquinone biosynthesis C-methylase UbiE
MRSDLYEDMYKSEETHWWHMAKRRFVGNLIKMYAQKKSLSLLDVGCGTGKNMEDLSRFGEVWGVDISNEALLFCKKRNLSKVKIGEAEHLPFGEKSFDVVSALDVLEHVDDMRSVREIKRVLKDGGYIIITVPAFGWLWSKWDEILHHKRRYTRKQLEDILTQEGFSIKRNTYIHSFLVMPSLIIRKLKQRQSKTYTSDFQINNSLTNTILSFISELEQNWINRYDMPFGTSVLCIAQKNP